MITSALAGAQTLAAYAAHAAGGAADPVAARSQMGFSLGWHIVVACLGVGMPGLVLFAEWRGQRTGDPSYQLLARRWARAMGVLFAVGAVSGTILSFEMGVLWSGLMDHYGAVIGLPFAIEGFAFFIEAIFLGIYLYGWDRLPPRVHLLSGIPIVVAGIASAFFVVSANAWMNAPRGYAVRHGRVVGVDPWAAIFNPATGPETTHMILAAFMVTGFVMASVYAVAMLRGRRDRYHRLGLLIPLTFAAVMTPVQIGVGDWAARFVAADQPVKLAAMEGLARTQTHAPESVGGLFYDGRLHGALRIPDGLSLLLRLNPAGRVTGLSSVPPADRPPVEIVHFAFDAMVGIGFALLALGAWLAWTWWRRRDQPGARWFLRAVALSVVAAVTAMEAGWVATEVGRQPWIVYHVLRTSNAVNPAPGLANGVWPVIAVYAALTVATVYVLRRLARSRPVPIAPQESDVRAHTVV
ncbi:MAG TPA: cytochrome ubiquinol oxidase subunit I [Streptosporangiaceae bacterium]|nr:cytochrome ubiquinol oxidase subunit I [Streptosporangiaceae bacterium]